MTVCGGMTITSSSRYVLAGSRDTANESRYDVGLQVSCQCSFIYHPSSPLLVIPVRDTGI
ncbi:hypothetical protein [Wolbachia endosymbiont of Aedes albopictus]|uniref:hypothetical protein n=1 Tax=Wolbachia endosymbiont of Aedes albopictus TaxID=167957 RepID=UPI0021681CBA|nr:hypothetical protein [Wolbachia endosymbiont of Aedes albopictus]UVW84351.1 hypothetical protein NHG98_02505 [Wolbachia endosymbiont of Aedes albopictus]